MSVLTHSAVSVGVSYPVAVNMSVSLSVSASRGVSTTAPCPRGLLVTRHYRSVPLSEEKPILQSRTQIWMDWNIPSLKGDTLVEMLSQLLSSA